MQDVKSFEAVFSRLIAVTGAKTDSALARILYIKPQSVVAAKKRRQIPSGWLVAVSEKFGVTTDWLFFGTGPMRSEHGSPLAEGAGARETETPSCRGGSGMEALLAKQEERIRELEQQLADAKDEALKAYRLAVDVMRGPQ